MEKNKNIVLVLLFIIIAVMACFGVKMSKEIFELKKGINTNINENQNNNNNEVNNNQNTNNDQNNVVNVNEEKKVEDINTITILKNNVDKILKLDGYVGNFNILSSLTVSDKAKLYIMLIENEKHKQNVDVNIDDIENKKIKDDYGNLLGKISIQNIEDDYKKMFDGTIKHQDFDNEYCPSFYYDDDHFYYIGGGCDGYGTGSHPHQIEYINRITSLNDKYFVYVNAGYVEYDSNDDEIVYNSINKERKLDNVQSTNSVNFEINETNYTQFSEYKFTFEKNSEGNYIYKSIERTK